MRENDSGLVSLLEARLGFVFQRPSLALAALTHRSWMNENPGLDQEDNERLEFLGDAVIDLAVSQRLMERLPASREGTLSRMRAALVNAEVLAEAASKLGLGELLRLGKGEEMTGGREKTSLLSNCLEAIIAAIYIEGGLAPVHEFVDRLLLPQIELLHLDVSGGRDYKTQVQEKAQALLGATPKYRVANEEGPDHDKLFTVELTVGEEVMGRGEGRSKKEAEQRAACEALERVLGKDATEDPVEDALGAHPEPVVQAATRPEHVRDNETTGNVRNTQKVGPAEGEPQ